MSRRDFGSIRKLKSGNYQARYTGPDLGRHNAPTTFRERKYARRWLDKEEELIEKGTWTPPAQRAAQQRVEGLTVEEYFSRVVERRSRRARKPISPTTADLYRKDYRLELADAFGDLQLREVTKPLVARWWDETTTAPTQKGRAYDLLKSVLAEAVEDELIPSNPCMIRGAGKPEPRRKGIALSMAELRTYLDAVPERYRLLLMISGLCGLRSGEVRALRRKDIDLANRKIMVEQAVTRVKTDAKDSKGRSIYRWRYDQPKTDAGIRTVSIPQLLLQPLKSHLSSIPMRGGDGLIFTGEDGSSPIHSSTIYDAHRKGREAVGQPTMTPHDLRRTAATTAAQNGATIAELMRLLGHTTAQVAMVYQSAEDQRDRERADRLDALLRAQGWA